MTLYRQYRPTTFAALFGQDTVRVILQNALARDRLAHAYLFSGPRGTGKTTTARILARAATCEKPVVKEKGGHAVYEPCNSCPSCQAQLADHAPDVVEIDAASNRGIEDIRQLREQAQYLPLQLKRKVYIIDEVHMLTPDAFNALLKTLEEPPRHCLFILATTELHKVPATIRSRCQHLRFKRGSVEAISAKLKEIVKKEGWDVEPRAIKFLAEGSAGGFRDAESVLEQIVTHTHPVTEQAAREFFGATDATTLTSLLNHALAGSLTETRTALQHLSVDDQPRCEQVMTALIEEVRSRIYASPAPSEAELLNLTEALTKLLEGFVLVKGSPHPKLVLESTCFEIAAVGQRGIKAADPEPLEESHTPSGSVQVQKPEKPEPAPRGSIPASPPAATLIRPRVAPPEPVAPVVELRDVAITDVRQAWKEVVKSIARESAPLAQMLREAVIHTAEDGLVTVHTKFKFHREKLSEKKNLVQVETLLRQVTHQSWKVEYHLKDTLPRRASSRQITGAATEAAAAVFGNA